MTKKQITWSTPKRVAKALEPVPSKPVFKKIRKIKYCKKTKGNHLFVEKERHTLGTLAKIFGYNEIISYRCKLCGKQKSEFKNS